jgi:hypothetical protein
VEKVGPDSGIVILPMGGQPYPVKGDLDKDRPESATDLLQGSSCD